MYRTSPLILHNTHCLWQGSQRTDHSARCCTRLARLAVESSLVQELERPLVLPLVVERPLELGLVLAKAQLVLEVEFQLETELFLWLGTSNVRTRTQRMHGWNHRYICTRCISVFPNIGCAVNYWNTRLNTCPCKCRLHRSQFRMGPFQPLLGQAHHR